MERPWIEFLRAPDDAGHAVQIYAEVEELAESVSAYLATGFAAGAPAIVVATGAHQVTFERFIAASGWDAAVLSEAGLLMTLDAEETLAAICDDGRLSALRFEEVLGGVIDRAAARFPGRHVRVFGEMVDLLAARGDLETAAELEELWNGLVQSRQFSLLCGYQVDVFDLDSQTVTMPVVCSVHTHVRPAYDLARLELAVNDALDDVLGRSSARAVHAIVRDDAEHPSAPLPAQVLMWMSDRMPRHARRVLAEARMKYESLAASPS